MGDKDAALSEKIQDISEAQREAQVQPDSMLDHHWREPIAAIAERFHCQTLPTIKRPDHGSPLDVTSPSRQWYVPLLRQRRCTVRTARLARVSALVQAITQDPFAAYNPFYAVEHALLVPIRNFGLAKSRAAALQLAEEACDQVGLNPRDTRFSIGANRSSNWLTFSRQPRKR